MRKLIVSLIILFVFGSIVFGLAGCSQKGVESAEGKDNALAVPQIAEAVPAPAEPATPDAGAAIPEPAVHEPVVPEAAETLPAPTVPLPVVPAVNPALSSSVISGDIDSILADIEGIDTSEPESLIPITDADMDVD